MIRRSPVPAGRLALLVALLAPTRMQAQAPPPPASALRGSVVDARTGQPLEGATVSLEVMPAGVVPGNGGGAAGLLVSARLSLTGEDGAYAFEGLSPGAYRVRVVRIGYRSATLDVHYDGPASPRVSIGLALDPVELEPVDVFAQRASPLTPGRGARAPDAEGERVRLERLRQARYPTPDTRVLTDADVAEAVTVGETDLLRALHHLPGVAAQDDWSAEPWTRAAPWDETRVTFDGLPLLDPMHLLGAFTAVDPDAIGSLVFHPGVRPVGAGEAAAALVELRTRRAQGKERLTGLGQLSPISARLSFDRPYGEGSGLTLSGRRSVLEDVTGWNGERRASDYVPYRFTDLSGRWDQVLADSLALVVSGLRNRDRVFGDVPDELKGARGSWGNTVLRGTLQSQYGGVRTRLTAGRSTYGADIEVVPWDEGRADLAEAVTAAPTHDVVRFDVAELTVAPVSKDGEPTRWELGSRRTSTSVTYRGPAPWPYPNAANAGSLDHASNAARTSFWGQVRERITPEVEMSAGLHLAVPDDGSGSGATAAWDPRLALAWTPTPELRISAAAGRHHQYEQALAAAGFTIGSALVPGHLWVSAAGSIPALRADVLTAGAELWLPGGWLASANGWLRATTGRLTASPDTGEVRARAPLVDTELDEGWVAGTARSMGLELGVRKLAGRWTGSVSWSMSRGRTTAEGRRYPTPGSRTHVLDAAVMFGVTPRTRVGAVLTAASGAAYTRFYAFRCTEVSWYCPEVDAGSEPVIGWVEAAGAERTPAYASLDLHVEHTGTLFGLPVGVWGQLRNALSRDNRAAYVGSVLSCAEDGTRCTLDDRFADGFPFLPLVGVWIRL